MLLKIVAVLTLLYGIVDLTYDKAKVYISKSERAKKEVSAIQLCVKINSNIEASLQEEYDRKKSGFMFLRKKGSLVGLQYEVEMSSLNKHYNEQFEVLKSEYNECLASAKSVAPENIANN